MMKISYNHPCNSPAALHLFFYSNGRTAISNNSIQSEEDTEDRW